MKLIIEHEQVASEEIEYRAGGRVSKHLPFERNRPRQLNPAAWCLGPYERYLRIYVDMGVPFFHNTVTIERETCEVQVRDEGTFDESYDFRVLRRTTRHALTGDELGAAWPEIERWKQEGVRLDVSEPMTILRDPYSVIRYTGF
jgi:hypothetical protein